MRIRYRRFLALLMTLALLAACGAKGPLVLPSDEPAPAPVPSE